MTVGMALIVRDEQDVIERCLDSFGDHVDQVAVVDTGSTDDTVKRVEAWAARHPDTDVRVGHFDWVDDFAAARNYADSLLTTDWVSWIDADDVLHGADQLKPLAASGQAGGYVADYDYVQNEQGVCVCRLRRERLVPAGAGTWSGRVHEAKPIHDPLTLVPPSQLEWRHRPSPKNGSTERNIRILESWLSDEPDNPRVLVYLGREHAARGKAAEARGYFDRYFRLDGTHGPECAQAHRHCSVMAMMEENWALAREHAVRGVEASPEWPDSYLTFAELAHHEKEWPRAIQLADRVLREGVPETVLIVNPLDYTVQPRTVIASALAGLSRWADAARIAQDGLKEDPSRPELAQGLLAWRSLAERDRLAAATVDLVQAAVAHDEQLKGLALLDAAPWMVRDHPAVVTARRDLHQRIAWVRKPADYKEHYTTGGSKPEDAVTDERLDATCEAVTRCGFLLGGLADQAGVELKQAEKEKVA